MARWRRKLHGPRLVHAVRRPTPIAAGLQGGSPMDRRSFMASAAGAGATLATAGAAFAHEEGAAMTRRFAEQRWALDNIIRANGIDWDQPRSLYISAPCGIEANADFAAIRQRVQKMADIGPAFETVARRREAKAKAALEADSKITARDNYFMAAVHWGAAQWPYDQNDETNIAYNQKKRECYTKYAEIADHHVEAVWIPFKDKAIPAWFHLPPSYKGGKLPVIIAVPGMDSYKEVSV